MVRRTGMDCKVLFLRFATCGLVLSLAGVGGCPLLKPAQLPPISDDDGDGVADAADVCPGFDDNVDADADGVPDGCDVCPDGDDARDGDGDGVPDACDVCEGFNDIQDVDSDGVPDGCDQDTSFLRTDLESFAVLAADGEAVDLSDLHVGDEIELSVPDDGPLAKILQEQSPDEEEACSCVWSVLPDSAGTFDPTTECTTIYTVLEIGDAVIAVVQTCRGTALEFFNGVHAESTGPIVIQAQDPVAGVVIPNDTNCTTPRTICVFDGETVTLDGSDSAADTQLAFQWEQIAGPRVALLNPQAPNAGCCNPTDVPDPELACTNPDICRLETVQLVAPGVGAAAQLSLRFQLTVTEEQGPGISLTSTTQVTVVVEPCPTANPVAEPVAVVENNPVVLTASQDTGLLDISYDWRQLAGPAVTFTDPTGLIEGCCDPTNSPDDNSACTSDAICRLATVRFVAPAVNSNGATLEFELEVSVDGCPTPDTDTVTVTVNDTPTPGCVSTCGNGAPECGEQCDGAGESATCDANCTFAVCGDGTLNTTAGEECDDGNTGPGDGCDQNCQDESTVTGACCLTATGQCLSDVSLAGCLVASGIYQGDGSICTPGLCPICGDGPPATGSEQCDDGSRCEDGTTDCTTDSALCTTIGGGTCAPRAGDGCDENCRFEVCGNGPPVQVGEQCDDGNVTPGDGCNANCQIEFCGDGVTNNNNEECDEGAVDTAGCDGDCTLVLCGDGYTNTVAGEACDDGVGGVPADSATCDSDCSPPVCGDGRTNAAAGEECDDGGVVPGDGCDENCDIEGRRVEGNVYRGDRDPAVPSGTLATVRSATVQIWRRDTATGNLLELIVQAQTGASGTYSMVIPDAAFAGGPFNGTVFVTADNDVVNEQNVLLDNVAQDGPDIPGDLVVFFNFYIDDDGAAQPGFNPSAPLGTLDNPHPTIQESVNLVFPGDSVFVKAGTYFETVSIPRNGTVDRRIVFENYQDALVTIDCELTRENCFFVGRNQAPGGGNYVTVDGFTCTNPAALTGSAAGVLVLGTDGVIIRNCHIFYEPFDGSAANSARGIFVQADNEDTIIEFNHVHHVFTGIETRFGGGDFPGFPRRPIIRSNHVHHINMLGAAANNAVGIGVKNGTITALVEHNVVHHCDDGGIVTDDSAGNHIIRYNIAYLMDHLDGQGNGPGIKLKPSQAVTPPAGDLVHHNVVFLSRASGFELNAWAATGMGVGHFLYNNLAYGNVICGFSLTGPDPARPEQHSFVFNNIAFGNGACDVGYSGNASEFDYNFNDDGPVLNPHGIHGGFPGADPVDPLFAGIPLLDGIVVQDGVVTPTPAVLEGLNDRVLFPDAASAVLEAKSLITQIFGLTSASQAIDRALSIEGMLLCDEDGDCFGSTCDIGSGFCVAPLALPDLLGNLACDDPSIVDPFGDGTAGLYDMGPIEFRDPCP